MNKELNFHLLIYCSFFALIAASLYLVYEISSNDKILLVVVSSGLTILIQTYLESSKIRQKSKQLAIAVIFSLNQREDFLSSITEQVLNSSRFSMEIRKRVVDDFINRFQADAVYESAIKEIGIFESESLKYFYDYDTTYKALESYFKVSLNENGLANDNLERLENIIWCNRVYGSILKLFLGKKFSKNSLAVQKNQDYLIKEYRHMKSQRTTKKVINDALEAKIINDALEAIEEVFEELSISNTL